MNPLTFAESRRFYNAGFSSGTRLGKEQALADLRAEFLLLLTTDSETKDRRRREYNQAIFNPEGWAVFNGTDLDMVMEKFDRAVRALAEPQP